jgi:hypothetical protein
MAAFSAGRTPASRSTEHRPSPGHPSSSEIRKPHALIGDRVRVLGEIRTPQRIPALPVRNKHIRRLAKLPELHKDPFDRILLQALAYGLTLATKDASSPATEHWCSGNGRPKIAGSSRRS